MGAISVKFPDYFPEGCPPPEAVGEERVLFRLCYGPVPTENDFVSHYQRNPEKFRENILAYGLSVFSTEDDCRTACKKSPLLRKKYHFCSYGMNTPERGKILLTPAKLSPAHITWWIYEGIEPHTFFETCDEGGGSNE